MKKTNIILALGVFSLFLLCSQSAFGGFSEPALSEYTCYPIFQTNAVEPNIMIILDNSLSMFEQAYYDAYDHNTTYYGYFEPYKKYNFASSKFFRDPVNGQWDGNFLNWLCMRRVDVARKVLMGGLVTARTGGGNDTCYGEAPGPGNYVYPKSYKDTDNVTPLNSTSTYNYSVGNGEFSVDSGSFDIVVMKDMNNFPDEANSFVLDDDNGYTLGGVLQKVGDKARWGNEWFYKDSISNGGFVSNVIGPMGTSLITDLQNTDPETYTPLAESYYVAMQYFKQEDVESGLGYKDGVPNNNDADDPFNNDDGVVVPCADAFVILLTDGAPTWDQTIPDEYKNYADSRVANVYINPAHNYFTTLSGSDYLKDLALYARTTDLRSATVGKDDLDGTQNMILYTIYAFGDDEHASNLLKEAAKNGGFTDRNGNNLPDQASEYDKDGDSEPDTYYEADNGYQLEAKLIKAVNDILERAAAGTSVSVLAPSEGGEGTLVQAYYRPRLTVGVEDLEWLGYLQSLWIDPAGNLREDSVQDQALNEAEDKIINYFVDAASGDTKIRRYAVSPADPYPDIDTAPFEDLKLEEISPIWEAGSILAQRDPVTRKIFTYIDKDEDNFPDSSMNGVLDTVYDNDIGEVISFDLASANAIAPYLGVHGNTWDYLGATHDDRMDNLINWIRGNDISGLRPRSADWDGDGDDEVWKLGDIVHSTPLTVAKPADRFHLLYGDLSYQYYYDHYKKREHVVYVGANDGMLHAFTSHIYDPINDKFVDSGNGVIGDELWAYIPQSLLPHLKWLPFTQYTHVYYMDSKVKIFDAKIFPDDTNYTDPDSVINGIDDDGDGNIDESGDADNWGTILLAGFNLGGGDISANEDFDDDGTIDIDEIRSFSPTYVCMDISNPIHPRLLWERSYQNLQKTADNPAVVKVGEKWFAVFGSGPSNCNGESPQNGYVYVVDLKTGDAVPNASLQNGTTDGWLFETAEDDAFMNSPVSLDKNMNYNVDAIYIGSTYDTNQGWKGKIHKITVPWVKEDPVGSGTYVYDGDDPLNYVDNPIDILNPWKWNVFFDAGVPITAPAALSVDELDNAWVYFGTGRYLNTLDKSNTDQQYLFGIKDPFYNQDHQPDDPVSPTPCAMTHDTYGCFDDNYYLNYNSTLLLDPSDLMDADPYRIEGKYLVYENASLIADHNGNNLEGEFLDLLFLARSTDGWKRSLTDSKERITTKPGVLFGTLFATSFVPNDDVCGYGGSGYLYGLYYETGTAYYRAVFVDHDVWLDKKDMGHGKPSEVGFHYDPPDNQNNKGGNVTAFVEQSTGQIVEEVVDTALKHKSGLTSWEEQ